MRKFLIMAVAAVVAVAGFAVYASADNGEAGTKWEFSVKPNKVNKAASSHSLGFPAKEVDGKHIAPKSQDFVFPKGSQVDTTALAQCKLTPSDVGRGEDCPKNTALGRGSAITLVGESDTSEGTELNSEFSAWNQKNKILFIFQPCGEGTGPGTGKDCEPAGSRIVIIGNWSKTKTQPTLRVPTPQNLLDIGITIVKFELFTDNHTKTVRKKGKKVLVAYVLTPKTCKGSWETFDRATYVDGSKQSIKDTQKCKKPKR